MRFAVGIAFVYVNLSLVFGQFWNNFYPIVSPSRTGEISVNQEVPNTRIQGSCDSYWNLMNDGNEIWGHMFINSPNRDQAIVKVVLTVPAALPTSYVGSIDILKSKESTSLDITNGRPIEYRIRFPLQNRLPTLTEIYYNNQLLCRGQKAVGQTVTTITLDHTFYVVRGSDNYFGNQIPLNPPIRQPVIQQPISQPVSQPISQPISQPVRQPISQPISQPVRQPIRQPPVTYAPQTQRPTFVDERISNRNFQCGEVKVPKATGLVLRGKQSKVKGQFPWLAIYYHNNDYICGATLVSPKIVITAAHCISEKSDVPKSPDEATIYVGRYDLSNNNEQDYQESGATRFIVHPDWKTEGLRYDADIAAIVLLNTIRFTTTVQPICLWDLTSNYQDMINRKGTVAGYGKTHASSTASNIPNYSELTVVDERTCFESDHSFIYITSRRTFCAGMKDGSGPCNGDSGGAFIAQSGNKYYLRGIVSSSLLKDGICDTNNYAVFTDVAMFKEWISTQMRTYG
ncbi:serine protease gd-like [Chironomus tepperi]|uniref:serine protease gd-like n=1 Tax=Chironomus tepperi TaxID=113505 RepID=UPI00391F30B6